MEKQFVTFDIAKKLKELGFNEKCFAWNNGIMFIYHEYKNEDLGTHACTRPLWQQVIDWFREEHNYNITYNILGKDGYYIFKGGEFQAKFKVLSKRCIYYEAREQAILKAIELIKTID